MFGRKKRQIERLLIVEDEPLVAFDNEHFLRDEGFEIVATVDRVADAVAVLADGVAVDLVLVDIGLADGSGLDVARAAKARGIAALFVTGACPDGGREVAAGCLTKPYTQRELLGAIDAIGDALAGKRARRVPAGFTLFQQVADRGG
ncbi:response regulator [Sphingomonas aracearum]|uniref:Response regulator n=1 Tax=Sphingomonas aracearum TaxID=2283317 RepID=A0A369VY60_9SPHN|nr:response regulator [Sphingomonas aracearum]RDE06060.1 response regulator [Sphingomonas aracearum]